MPSISTHWMQQGLVIGTGALLLGCLTLTGSRPSKSDFAMLPTQLEYCLQFGNVLVLSVSLYLTKPKSCMYLDQPKPGQRYCHILPANTIYGLLRETCLVRSAWMMIDIALITLRHANDVGRIQYI